MNEQKQVSSTKMALSRLGILIVAVAVSIGAVFSMLRIQRVQRASAHCAVSVDFTHAPAPRYWIQCKSVAGELSTIEKPTAKNQVQASGISVVPVPGVWDWLYAEYGFDGRPDALTFHYPVDGECVLVETVLPNKPYKSFTVECSRVPVIDTTKPSPTHLSTNPTRDVMKR